MQLNIDEDPAFSDQTEALGVNERSASERHHDAGPRRDRAEQAAFQPPEIWLPFFGEDTADGSPLCSFNGLIEIDKIVSDRVRNDRSDRALAAPHESGEIDPPAPLQRDRIHA